MNSFFWRILRGWDQGLLLHPVANGKTKAMKNVPISRIIHRVSFGEERTRKYRLAVSRLKKKDSWRYCP